MGQFVDEEAPAAPAGRFLDDEPAAPKPGVGEILLKNLKAVPGRALADVKGVGSAIGNAASAVTNLEEPLPRTPLSTALPLVAGGPGSSVVTRLGAMAAGKMLDNPSTDPMENLTNALKGVVGDWRKPLSMVTSPATMEAIFPAAAKVFRSTGPGRRAINAADAENFGTAAGEVAPTLQPGMTAPAMQRTAEGQGLARIGAGKEAAVSDIEAALNAAPAQTPHFTNAQGQGFVRGAQPGQWAPARLQGEIPIPSVGRNMTLRDANAELSSIGDQMRGIKPLDPRFPRDVDLRAEYGRLADDIRNGVAQVAGPDAAAQWTAGQGAYRAGREISGEMLSRPNLFRQGEFTLAELQRWLKNPDNRAELARSLGGNLGTGQNLGPYNRLTSEIQRGAPVGMVDQLAGQAPGLLSGRGSYGSWRVPLEMIRRVLPNASSSYVGRVPYTVPASAQTLADIGAERAGAR